MIAAVQRTSLLLPIPIIACAPCDCSPGGGSFDLTPPSVTVGGTVNGLVGSGLPLTRNGSTIGRGANGTYLDLGCTTSASRFVHVAKGSPDSLWTYTIDATTGALTAGTGHLEGGKP